MFTQTWHLIKISQVFLVDRITKNDVSGYVIGLCVQTNGADIRDNNVHGNCIGTFVDPRTRGARIKNNHVGPTNAICNAIPDIIQPDFMHGIVVDGATDTLVQGNVIEGQRSNGTATGIVAPL
ncbi:hypothetical protein B0A55_10957 [Friedmanniomyces simplex]|uniref:Right handed beta helix domain-containing protein n=1 Tax=Friedmanniomyces simplex TaxID=329884 RepID=A0A4U0WWG9_9PEZI|nr:hypothetical protein B0A55_10957 [Friedmanniomyces simplex]